MQIRCRLSVNAKAVGPSYPSLCCLYYPCCLSSEAAVPLAAVSQPLFAAAVSVVAVVVAAEHPGVFVRRLSAVPVFVAVVAADAADPPAAAGAVAFAARRFAARLAGDWRSVDLDWADSNSLHSAGSADWRWGDLRSADLDSVDLDSPCSARSDLRWADWRSADSRSADSNSRYSAHSDSCLGDWRSVDLRSVDSGSADWDSQHSARSDLRWADWHWAGLC